MPSYLGDSRQPESWIQELVLKFADGEEETFFLELTRSGRFKPRPVTEPEPWTKLEYHKCDCCPLPERAAYCPAASSLEETLYKLRDRSSFEKITATAVDGENRKTVVEWPLQQVGASLVQLAVFKGGCPIGAKYQRLIRDLRPFCTTRELAKHIIAKILLRHKGDIAAAHEDITGNLKLLGEVFRKLLKRLEDTYRENGKDAIPNSIVAIDAMFQSMSRATTELSEELMRDI